MTYIAPADFRQTTLAEYCSGLSLTTDEASDAILTSAIARQTQRIDDLTNDHFETETSQTFELNGWGRPTLVLPKRCTAVTTVKTRSSDGVLTTQAATVWRLVSSLNSAGSVALSDMDYLEVIPGKSLSGTTYFLGWTNGWGWPYGAQTVQVVGTFSWTVTPPEIKRATALLVWNEIKALGPVLRTSTTYATIDANYDVASVPPAAQDIIDRYTRKTVPF